MGKTIGDMGKSVGNHRKIMGTCVFLHGKWDGKQENGFGFLIDKNGKYHPRMDIL